MEKFQTSKQVEQLLQQGRTKEAINLLLDFLERREKESPELYKALIQIKARWLRAKRQRGMGIITAKKEEEVMVNLQQDVYVFLNWFNGKSSIQSRAWWLKIPNYIYGLVLLSVSLLTVLTWSFTKQQVTQKANAHCPIFDETAEFNILLLPIEATSRTALAKQQTVQEHFDLYIDSMNLSIDAAWSDLEMDSERYPTNAIAANEIARSCQAQMIVWADREFVHYQLNQEETVFGFYELYPGVGDTLMSRPISIAISSRAKVKRADFPNILNFLLGTAANQIEDYSSAAQLMRTPLQDSSNVQMTIWKYLQLADSEMEVDNLTKAIEAYDYLLQVRPDLNALRMNRAVLSAQNAKYAAAFTDLSKLLTLDSTNIYAQYTKGRTLANMMQIGEAELVFKQLDSLLVLDSTQTNQTFKVDVLDKTLSDIAKRTYEIQRNLRLSRNTLRQYPDNADLCNDVLQLLLQLGEDEKAFELLETVSSLDSASMQSIEYRLLALQTTGQTNLFQQWKDWMAANGRLLEAKVIQVVGL